MTDSKRAKKHIIVLLILLLPIWLTGISNYLFSWASFSHTPGLEFDMENATNVFPYDVLNVIGYQQDGSVFTAISDDPQIFVAPPPHKVATVLIALENPVQSDQSISIYYAMTAHPLDERNISAVKLPAGSSEAIVSLPMAYFTTIRVDIDIFDEPFELRGIYLSESSVLVRQWVGNYDGVLMALIMSVFVIAFCVAGLYTGYTDRLIERCTQWITYKRRYIKENPGKLLMHAGIIVGIVLFAFIAETLLSVFIPSLGLVGAAGVLFFATAGLSVYCVVLFRGKPEKQFLSLSLLIGLLFIVLSPPFWYGADQQIRYAWAVEESFVRTVSISRADWILANCGEGSQVFLWNLPPAHAYLPSAGDNEIIRTFTKDTDTLSKMGLEFEGVRSLYVRLANIPAGLMIFLGRSLALPPFLVIRLGVLGNHLLYTTLVYHAMKRLSSGKYILAVIALLPTSIVVSTTYGYDYWLTAFVMLGFAYYFHEVQNPDKKIEIKSIVIMIGAFALSMGPRTIYFPLMLFLYFIKKDKFRTQKGYAGYMIGVSCAVLLALGSFALPFLADGGGGGDYRGGEDVNASAQTMLILQDPIAYAKILIGFILEYLISIHTTQTYHHLQHYVTFFIHLGTSVFYYVTWALLGFVTLTDRNEKDALTSKIGYKALISFLTLSTFAAISTAMYIAFTPVGADTIAGVQGRYLMSFLFPFFYIVGGFRIRNNMNESTYSMAVYGIMSVVLLTGVLQKFVPLFQIWYETMGKI